MASNNPAPASPSTNPKARQESPESEETASKEIAGAKGLQKKD